MKNLLLLFFVLLAEACFGQAKMKSEKVILSHCRIVNAQLASVIDSLSGLYINRTLDDSVIEIGVRKKQGGEFAISISFSDKDVLNYGLNYLNINIKSATYLNNYCVLFFGDANDQLYQIDTNKKITLPFLKYQNLRRNKKIAPPPPINFDPPVYEFDVKNGVIIPIKRTYEDY